MVSSSSDNEEESCGSDVEEIRARGNRAYKKKLYKKALRFYSAGLDLDSKIVDLWSNRAMTYAAQELWAKCEHDAEAALKLDPKHKKARYQHARALLKLKRYEEAVKTIEQSSNPDAPEFKEQLQEAVIQLARGKITEGTDRKFEGTEDQFQENIKAGRQAFADKDWNLAIDKFTDAIAIGTAVKREKGVDELLECYSAIGRCYMQINKPMEAGLVYFSLQKLQTRLLGVDKGRQKIATTLNNIGICARQCGNYQEALDALTQAWNILTNSHETTVNPELPSILNNLGQVHTYMGNYQKAQTVYERSRDINLKMYHEEHGTVAIDYLCLGRCLARQDKFQAALECYERSLRIWTGRPWDQLQLECPQAKTPEHIKLLFEQAKSEYGRLKERMNKPECLAEKSKITEVDEDQGGDSVD